MTYPLIAPRVILADNASPLTGRGTNTFVLGKAQVGIIDPGPDLPQHREAILQAVGKGKVTHILVTHAHLDHSEGARALSEACDAPILAYGEATAGRSPVMARLAASGRLRGGEGLDMAFRPDQTITDGSVIETDEWSLTALHTPGHFAGHLSFAEQSRIYCGDIVLGWSSTLISPPDGDLADYFRSLSRLAALNPSKLLPAHGDPVTDPAARFAELAAHRRERTAQILAALRQMPGTATDLAGRIYDIPSALMPAAARNVLAHLVALSELGAVIHKDELTAASVFHLA